MQWDDLKYFLAVARYGSLRKAACHLKTSAATVGRRIIDLETRLAAHLFDRNQAGFYAHGERRSDLPQGGRSRGGRIICREGGAWSGSAPSRQSSTGNCRRHCCAYCRSKARTVSLSLPRNLIGIGCAAGPDKSDAPRGRRCTTDGEAGSRRLRDPAGRLVEFRSLCCQGLCQSPQVTRGDR